MTLPSLSRVAPRPHAGHARPHPQAAPVQVHARYLGFFGVLDTLLTTYGFVPLPPAGTHRSTAEIVYEKALTLPVFLRVCTGIPSRTSTPTVANTLRVYVVVHTATGFLKSLHQSHPIYKVPGWHQQLHRTIQGVLTTRDRYTPALAPPDSDRRGDAHASRPLDASRDPDAYSTP